MIIEEAKSNKRQKYQSEILKLRITNHTSQLTSIFRRSWHKKTPNQCHVTPTTANPKHQHTATAKTKSKYCQYISQFHQTSKKGNLSFYG